MEVKRKIKCNLCGLNNYELVYSKGADRTKKLSEFKDEYSISESNIQKPEKIFKCNVCGLIFAQQNNNPFYYADKYTELVDREYVEEAKGRRRASIEILKRIEKYNKRGRLLDIGCANGFFLDEARRRGWEVYGLELSKWAANYAKEQLNLNVTRGSLKEAAFEDGSFNVIVMSDVIEHLTDPKYTLVEVRRILNNNGILYINTPNISSLMSRVLKAKWWGINKFHLFYFSKRTLENMLDSCGFKVKKYSAHVRIFSVKYCLGRFRIYNNTLYRFLDFISRIGKFQSMLLKINFHDQIEILAEKVGESDCLASSVAAKKEKIINNEDRKVFVILPAYNAEKTLKMTMEDIPKKGISEIILVDDGSNDGTATLAERLGITVISHGQNKGYGAAQKTGYKEALKKGADIVVMVHADHQYDPTLTPEFIGPIASGKADAVTGSRMLNGGALKGGMPIWKYIPNRFLTKLENFTFNTNLTDYHNGFRAYGRKVLESVPFEKLSDRFDFDTDIILQIAIRGFKISEVAHHTRYRQENSQMSFSKGIRYGIGILLTVGKFKLHQWGIKHFELFEIKDPVKRKR